MYLRMMNKLDVSCMKETIQEAIKNPAVFKKVFGRISDAIASLDEAYGEGREALSMGGFVFLLTDSHNSAEIRRKILECYSLSAANYRLFPVLTKTAFSATLLVSDFLAGRGVEKGIFKLH